MACQKRLPAVFFLVLHAEKIAVATRIKMGMYRYDFFITQLYLFLDISFIKTKEEVFYCIFLGES